MRDKPINVSSSSGCFGVTSSHDIFQSWAFENGLKQKASIGTSTLQVDGRDIPSSIDDTGVQGFPIGQDEISKSNIDGKALPASLKLSKVDLGHTTKKVLLSLAVLSHGAFY